jgi:hypothetical protein
MAFLADAYVEEFRTLVVAVMQLLDMPEVAAYTMRLGQAEQHVSNYVLWIPRSLSPTNEVPSSSKQEVISIDFLPNEDLRIECHISGQCDGAPIDAFEWTETIRRNLVAAVFQVSRDLGRDVEIGSAVYVTQEENKAAHAYQNSELVIQQFDWTQPVPKKTQKTSTINVVPEHKCILLPAWPPSGGE